MTLPLDGPALVGLPCWRLIKGIFYSVQFVPLVQE